MGLDLQDEKTLRRLLLVTLIVVCLLVAGVIGLLTRGDARPEAKPTAIPTADLPSASPTDRLPAQTETPKASEAEVPKETATLVGDAVKAYTQYSYRDSGPSDWVKRLEPYATEHLVHELEEMFTDDQQADWAWKQDILPNKEESKTTVVGASLDRTFHEVSATEFTYLVVYTKSVNRTDTDGWTTPTQRMSLFVTVVKQGDAWKVSEIKPPAPTG